MDTADTVVIGAGVVGLAVARSLALTGRDVLVLEACETFGTQTSARNSEVIHAGIYYSPHSLKARLCVEGKRLLYAYLQDRHLPFRRTGKLIVATSVSQLGALEALKAQGEANGVRDLQILGVPEAQALEPELDCMGALLSPSTGIVDSHALMLSLLGDLEAAGGTLAVHSPFSRAYAEPDGIVVVTEDGTELKANIVVNSAGLQACDVARRCRGMRLQAIPPAHFAKGSYFSLATRGPFSRLIYPVPEAAGLGVHLTLDLGGQTRFGPDVQWVGSPDDVQVDPRRSDAFYSEIRKYWPGLPDDALQPAYAGIRPKISGPGASPADFLIQDASAHGVPGWVNLLGIESPGLTSALAIGEFVKGLVPGT